MMASTTTLLLLLAAQAQAQTPAPAASPGWPTLRSPDAPLSVAAVDVVVQIDGRLARTEVRSTFHNASARQAEGTYTLELPAGASLSRLAMEIDGKLVEGELEERERARSVYENIVRQTRDPALAEWQGENRFQMQVFPIPANGDKRVVVAWEQILDETPAGVVYRLPLGSDRVSRERIGKLTLNVDVVPRADGAVARVTGFPLALERDAAGVLHGALAQTDAAPSSPLAIELTTSSSAAPPVRVGTAHGQTLFLASVGLGRAGVAPSREGLARDVVFAVDTSAGIGSVELEREKSFVRASIERLPRGARFAIVHGDLTADRCATSKASATANARADVDACLAALDAGGASDVGALLAAATAAAKRFERPAAIVIVGDGVATVGELDEDLLRQSLVDALRGLDITVHAVMVGQAPAEDTLRSLARAGGGHATRMTPSDDPAAVAAAAVALLRVPLVRDVRVKVVAGTVEDLSPSKPVDVARGEALAVLGRLVSKSATLEVSGTLAGRALSERVTIDRGGLERGEPREDALLGRAFARAKVRELETAVDVDRAPVVALSKEWGVQSRYTSFLVLENDEAYKRFSVDRARERENEAAAAASAAPAAVGNVKKTEDSLQSLVGSSSGGTAAGVSMGAVTGVAHGAAAAPPPATARPALRMAKATIEESPEADKRVLAADHAEREDGGAVAGPAEKVAVGGGGDVGRGRGVGALSGRRAGEPSIAQGAPMVQGSLDAESIKRVVRAHAPQVRYCYERELQRSPALAGKLSVEWTIAPDGTVPAAQVKDDRVGGGVGACVVARVKTWQFPSRESGGAVRVAFPWVFRPAGDDTEKPKTLAQLRAELRAHPDDVDVAVDLYEALASDPAQADSESGAPSTRALMTLAPKGQAAIALWNRVVAELSPAAAAIVADAWTAAGTDDEFAAAVFDADPDWAVRQPQRVNEWLVRVFKADAPAQAELVAPLASTAVAAKRVGATVDVIVPLCEHTKDDAVLEACDAALPLLAGDARAKAALEKRLRPQLAEVVARRHGGDYGSLDDIALEASLRERLGDARAAMRTLSEMVELAPRDHAARVRYAQELSSRKRVQDGCKQLALAVQLAPAERDTFLTMMQLRRDNEGDARVIRSCIVDAVSKLPVQRALSIVLTWEDPEADVDLHIFEPGGEEIWYSHRESEGRGGFLYHDVTDGFGPEIYVLGPKNKGTYKLKLVHYASGKDRIRGTVTILRHAGSAEETRQDYPFTIGKEDPEKQIPLTDLRL